MPFHCFVALCASSELCFAGSSHCASPYICTYRFDVCVYTWYCYSLRYFICRKFMHIIRSVYAYTCIMYIIHIIYYISIYYVIYIIDQSIYNIYYIFIVSPHPTPTPTHLHTHRKATSSSLTSFCWLGGTSRPVGRPWRRRTSVCLPALHSPLLLRGTGADMFTAAKQRTCRAVEWSTAFHVRPPFHVRLLVP